MLAAAEALKTGEVAAAISAAQARLSADPDDPDALGILVRGCGMSGRIAEMCKAADRLARVAPDDAVRQALVSDALRRAGHLDRARDTAMNATRLDPKSVEAWFALGSAGEETGDVPGALAAFRRVLELAPGNRDMRSSFLYFLYRTDAVSPAELLREHRQWAQLHADTLTGGAAPHANTPDPERRLRIGYVSGDFRQHVVSYFIEPVLQSHDRGRFEVFAYANVRKPDAITARLQQCVDHWIDIHSLDDAAAADRVRRDCIDILVDLSGHTFANRLLMFARKPAPVQAGWLGYLGTTGLQAMDYSITDPVADPRGMADADYSEALLRLPVTQWCYRPPADAPEVTPLPADGCGGITFGCVADYFRLNAATFEAWARILSAVPDSRLRVLGAPVGEALDSLLNALEGAGIAGGRIETFTRVPHSAYLDRLGEIDIVLGSHPYSGATTTCEALWMGVPVVCRTGLIRPSRSSASVLQAAGLGDLVASDWPGYVDRAVVLSRDRERLRQLRAGLRQRLRSSPLMLEREFTASLEELLRGAWRRWCASRTHPSGFISGPGAERTSG